MNSGRCCSNWIVQLPVGIGCIAQVKQLIIGRDPGNLLVCRPPVRIAEKDHSLIRDYPDRCTFGEHTICTGTSLFRVHGAGESDKKAHIEYSLSPITYGNIHGK